MPVPEAGTVREKTATTSGDHAWAAARALESLGAGRRFPVERADACTSPAYPFDDGGCGGVRLRDPAKIQFEVGPVGRESWSTRVLEAAHVVAPQPAADRDSQYVTLTRCAYSRHTSPYRKLRA